LPKPPIIASVDRLGSMSTWRSAQVIRDAAIRDLTRVGAREPVELAAEVVVALGAWWATHGDTDDHYEAAHVAELRALPEPQRPPRHEPQPPPRQEPQPPPRDIKSLSINRKYLRLSRTR
jgi:hypothetical protein